MEQAVEERTTEAPIKLHGRTLVGGCTWQPPTAALDSAKVKREGLAAGFGLMLKRRAGRQVQVGYLAKSAEGLGAYSIAAALARAQKKDNWIGVFRLSDARYALVAVRDGAIMSGRDQIGTRGAIEQLLMETVQLVEQVGGQWEAVYAPKEFETPWPELPLFQALPKSELKAADRLKGLKGEMTRQQVHGLVAGAVATVLLGGAAWGVHLYRKQIEERMIARSGEVVKVRPPHPWLQEPSPKQMFSAWREARGGIPISLGGWRATAISFKPQSVVVAYQRDGGVPVNAFWAEASSRFPGQVALGSSGTQAEITLPVAMPPRGSLESDDALLDADSAMLEWRSYFQNKDLAIPALSKSNPELPPAPPQIPGRPRQVWDTPDWTVFQWKMTSDWAPATLLQHGSLPGLRVKDVKMVLADGMTKWEISGVFYAKN
ncbi:type 4b pilus protein PilO2 [Chromobacterium violaceum]|uniref:type 4b pilus protein PilO2 n=1 Tax=Chromobacterium violaceum TaxID=536 RepID=UPI0005D32F3B|nr:type 4b pilus protein PilO2 [Chromobacterium violaceum]KJH67531.1 hypothetical protein UF16_09835 [Chromobacterium violaceum]